MRRRFCVEFAAEDRYLAEPRLVTSVKAFRIRGAFRMGRNRQPFTREVAAESQEEAVQRVLSELGSKHRAKRRDIAIQEVSEVPRAEIEDSVVAYQLEEN